MRGLGSDGLYYDVKFIHDCLNNPVGVSNAFGGDISPDVMFAISPQMIAQYRLMALQPRRRRPASAHRHEIHRNIKNKAATRCLLNRVFSSVFSFRGRNHRYLLIGI